MPFPIIQDITSSGALPEHIVSSPSLGKLVSLALASPLVVFTDVDGENAVHGSSYSLSFCQSFPVMDSCMSYGDERRDVVLIAIINLRSTDVTRQASGI